MEIHAKNPLNMASLLYQLHVAIAVLKSKPDSNLDNQRYHSMIMSQDIKCMTQKKLEQINSTTSAQSHSYRLKAKNTVEAERMFYPQP